MPVYFKELFQFHKSEVQAAFAVATAAGYARGFKLLKAPGSTAHSKLLIVTPRASGKAHERNLVRRRAKAIFYELAQHEVPTNWILLVYKRSAETSFETLKNFLVLHTAKNQ
jgi:ribonuclease P protein component